MSKTNNTGITKYNRLRRYFNIFLMMAQDCDLSSNYIKKDILSIGVQYLTKKERDKETKIQIYGQESILTFIKQIYRQKNGQTGKRKQICKLTHKQAYDLISRNNFDTKDTFKIKTYSAFHKIFYEKLYSCVISQL